MNTKTRSDALSPLARVLPGAQFAEHHSGIVDAPPEEVWAALQGLRWRDLRVGLALTSVRGMAVPVAHDTIFATFTSRAGAVYAAEPPHEAVLAMIGQPWSPVPRHRDAASLAEVADFTEPGWLKYGMEFLLHPLGDGRTLVETRTLCEATSPAARAKFTAYWALIRVGSSVIRLEIIGALRRKTRG